VIRIAITAEAYDAIVATLPVGSVAYEPQLGVNGEVFVRLEDRWLSKLGALRGPWESYSDVILGLAAAEYGF
jgi:hypothetical protein